MKGKIIKINFVDKGGRENPDVFNYYFETEEDTLFIKFSEGKVRSDEIAEYLGKEIEIEGYKSSGLWDTDDPMVQSRVGDYVVINRILNLNN